MTATIKKWGNSLALRIPRSVASDTCLESGSVVSLTVQDGRVIVEPVAQKKYTLGGLLKAVSNKNIHPSIETGRAVGREAW